MCQQLIASAPRVAKIATYEDPPISDHEVKITVDYASPKHGTEVVDFRGISPFMQERFDTGWQIFVKRDPDEDSGVAFGRWNLGNQFVGRIVETGKDVKDYQVDDRVCGYGGIRQTQISSAIDNYRLRKIPASSCLSEESLWKNALCYDPAQFALGGIRDAHIRPGDRVAIFGLGAIGLIAAQWCVKIGASVVGIDPIQQRRDLALQYGCGLVLDAFGNDVGFELKRYTDRQGVDAVIETSGHPSALQQALRGLAYGGTIAYVAFGKEITGGLNFGKEAHFNYAKIVFSRAASEPNPDFPRWNRRRIEDVCWSILMSGFLDCSDIIHPVVPFSQSAEAYMHFVDQAPEESIKLGIRVAKDSL